MTDLIDLPLCDALSEQDLEHLERLEQKFQLVRDRTAAVVLGHSHGFFLHGDGGLGKSFTVLGELERLRADFRVFNSRMTGRGLFGALGGRPDAVHVLEDMEQLANDRAAQGVLRSALWGQRAQGGRGPAERLVTWTTARGQESFVFTGGVIVTSNRPLADLPELRAVRTRVASMELQAGRPELVALMRDVARKGYRRGGVALEPRECREVCEYVVEQSRARQRPLDMRLLVQAFEDYAQWQEGEAGCHWRDLVGARLRERPAAFGEPVVLDGRAARKEKDREAARQVRAATEDRAERTRLWKGLTGKSEAALYRRLAELRCR